MNDMNHNLAYGWTGAPKGASDRLRVVPTRQHAVVSLQDMVKI
ncbi:MAG TPA: hypothetical protein VL426_02390 [Candidatus Binatia bacterium]|nr:hypothetical protein [Candidatus Binatia bacterium]